MSPVLGSVEVAPEKVTERGAGPDAGDGVVVIRAVGAVLVTVTVVESVSVAPPLSVTRTRTVCGPNDENVARLVVTPVASSY